MALDRTAVRPDRTRPDSARSENSRPDSLSPSAARRVPLVMEQETYWTEKLRGIPESLNLPFDRPAGAKESYTAAQAEQEVALGEDFAAFLAGVVALLCRYTGGADVVVVARTSEHGPLPVRVTVADEAPFSALIEQVRQAWREALGHAIDWRAIARVAGRGAALVGVTFGAEGAPREGEAVCFAARAGKVVAHYNAALFDRATVERMLGHLAKLLSPENAAQPVGRMAMLDASERRQLLEAWNQTKVDYPWTLCFHQVFERHAAERPEAPALAYGQQGVSYGQLNAQANRLAHYLMTHGLAKRGDLVGIAIHRSVDMVVALLAALKLGAAYVPMDPTYPAERVRATLEDAQASVLLTTRDVLPALGHLPSKALCLDEMAEKLARCPETNPAVAVEPGDLAYLIYTSGSTGKPKGAMLEHRNLMNYLHWAAGTYPLRGGIGAPVQSSLAFDLTVTSLLLPLYAGQRVRLLPEETGIEALGSAVREEQDFSLIKITPAHLDLLAHQLRPEEARGIARCFVIGGEALLGTTVKYWLEHCPGARLINEYGPTETTVGCCVYEVPPESIGHLPASIPIGRPIANTRLYVLDRHLEPVPIGVTGELYIGGDGVGRGYFRRPEQTAKVFLRDPFVPETTPAARLYKTGDLAKYLPDGTLVYLGRIDHQVKIRGYRVELEEIEAALLSLPHVREAAVAAREDTPGDKRLVAYLVSEVEPDMRKIRSALAARLPAHMVPAGYVRVERLPLSVNGKVERRALPAPDAAAFIADEAFIEPRTEAETDVARVFGEVLGTRRVGARDSFFDLGGHSLLVVQLQGRLEKAFGVKVPLSTLFRHPRVEEIAAVLTAQRPALPAVVKTKPTGTLPPFFWVHGDDGNTLYCTELARLIGSDRPFYELHAQATSRPRAQWTLEGLATDCLTAMKSIQPKGPYYLGGHCDGGVVAYEMARQLAAAGESVVRLALVDIWMPGPKSFKGRVKWTLRRALGLDRRGDAAARTFTQVVAAYWPGRYEGTAALFVPDVTDEGWSVATRDQLNALVRPAIRLERLPGEHNSMLQDGTYLGPFAERLKAFLDR